MDKDIAEHFEKLAAIPRDLSHVPAELASYRKWNANRLEHLATTRARKT